MKLTKAQEATLKEAKAFIDKARSCETYEEYAYQTNHYWRGRYTLDEARPLIKKNDDENDNFYSKLFEEYKKGYCLLNADTRTLKKLEELGLIEIVRVGGTYIDKARVIGY